MAHTEGPWSISFGGAGNAYIYGADHKGDRLAAVIPRVSKEHAIEERDANARLIASAPDLLDVARMLIKLNDVGSTGAGFTLDDAVLRARAAVAKVDPLASEDAASLSTMGAVLGAIAKATGG